MTTESAVAGGSLTRIKRLGEGAYGRVYLVNDKVANRQHAIKRNIFDCPDSAQEYFILAMSELHFMAFCHIHPYMIKATNVFLNENPMDTMLSPLPRNKKADPMLVLMNVARGDLYELYRETGSRQFLQQSIRCLFTQLMLALEFLHEHGICHRDVKAENILIYWDDETPEEPFKPLTSLHLELSDLGMTKHLDTMGSISIMTPQYRAPEVAFGYRHYNTSVDMWSAGIVLYFMLTRQFLFRGGNSADHHQTSLLEEINRVLPLEHVTYMGAQGPHFSPDPRRESIENKLKVYRTQYPHAWPHETEYREERQTYETSGELPMTETLNLLNKLLTLNLKRPTPTEILAHPWFSRAEDQFIIEKTRVEVPHGFGDVTFQPCLEESGFYIRSIIANMFSYFRQPTQPGERKAHVENRKLALDYRSMFLAIDIADRCLVKNPNLLGLLPVPSNLKSTAVYKFMAYACYYIAYKYFCYNRLTVRQMFRLDAVFEDPTMLEYLREIEVILLSHDCLSFIIYRPTVYEVTTNREDKFLYTALSQIIRFPEKYANQPLRAMAKTFEAME